MNDPILGGRGILEVVQKVIGGGGGGILEVAKDPIGGGGGGIPEVANNPIGDEDNGILEGANDSIGGGGIEHSLEEELPAPLNRFETPLKKDVKIFFFQGFAQDNFILPLFKMEPL